MNFNEKCYTVLKKVPKGKVVTYKQIARKLHSNGYRAVGNAMNKNKNLDEVKCHRVVCSDGRAGGYAFGSRKKIDILKKEGVDVVKGRVDLSKYSILNTIFAYQKKRDKVPKEIFERIDKRTRQELSSLL